MSNDNVEEVAAEVVVETPVMAVTTQPCACGRNVRTNPTEGLKPLAHRPGPKHPDLQGKTREERKSTWCPSGEVGVAKQEPESQKKGW